MAGRVKPKKRGVVPEDASSSGSESWKDETTRELSKKKRTVHRGVSTGTDEGDDNGVADDSGTSEAGHTLERPKTRRGVREDDPDVRSDESETEELDAAKLFTLLYTICDNVKKNTRCLKELQQAHATQHSRY